MAANSLPMVAGMAFAAFAIILPFLLMRRRKLTPTLRFGLLLFAMVMGFLFFAPMFPWQIQQIILGGNPQLPLPLWVMASVLSVVIAASLLFGKAFCGYGCPIGAVQEMLYLVPIPKLQARNPSVTQAIRVLALVIMVILGTAFSINTIGWFGLKDFFGLALASTGALVFSMVLIGSLAYYRPFCRLVCPFGVFTALASLRPVYSIRRTEACNHCRKCERICPTDQAGEKAGKAECYLCLRCVDACPKGALIYERKNAK